MADRPYIVIHYKVIGQSTPFQYGVETYEWVGDVRQPVFISDMDLPISSLPWSLTPIGDYDYSRAGRYYLRTDTKTWRLVKIKYDLAEFGKLLKYRIIWTLAVWGLARIEHGKTPEWRDVEKK